MKLIGTIFLATSLWGQSTIHGTALCSGANCTATTSTINMTGATVITILAAVQGADACNNTSTEDSSGNTYDCVANAGNLGSSYGDANVALWQSINPTVTSSMTFHSTTTGTSQVLYVIGLSGTSTYSNALDVWGIGYTGNSWSPLATQILSPTLNGDACVSVVQAGWGGTLSAAVSGATILDQNPTGAEGASAYLIQTTATPFSLSWSGNGSSTYAASFVACYKASGAPAPSRPTPQAVIYDTDLGNDVDDVIGLGMLFRQQQLGQVSLKALIATTAIDKAAALLDTTS